MKSRRSGNDRLRIKSARNMTVPLRRETTTVSRPEKSRAISRDISSIRRAICVSVMRMRSTSLRHRGGTTAPVRAELAGRRDFMTGVCCGFSATEGIREAEQDVPWTREYSKLEVGVRKKIRNPRAENRRKTEVRIEGAVEVQTIGNNVQLAFFP